MILFSPSSTGVQRVLATGGSVSAVTQLNQGTGESAHYYPQFLAGGKEFLYLNRNRDGTQSWISVGSLEGKPSVRLVQSTYRAIYSAATGHLLFIQKDGPLMAQRMDPGPYRLAGTPLAVAEQVGLSPSNAFADFSISDTGVLFYGRGTRSQKLQFVWRDRNGKMLRTFDPPVESVRTFALSPDESRVAYQAVGSPGDVWVLDLQRGVTNRDHPNGRR